MTCTMVVWLMGVGLAGQGAVPVQVPAQQMSENVFKNIQVLRGIPVDEFMGTMGVFSAALGLSCEDCHTASSNNWANYAADVSPRKAAARRMTLMVANINRQNFGGRQVVTCFTCHRGADKPRVTVNLDALYSAPPPEEDGTIFPVGDAAEAEKILDKYIQAAGGAQRLAALRSFTAKGTFGGYGPDAERRPVEIFARAPAQRSTVVRDPVSGDATTTYNGGTGAWVSAPFRPVAVLELHGAEVDSAKIEAALAFPGAIKQTLTGWRVGLPSPLNGREQNVIQGMLGGATATLHFDAETGLLTRLVRTTSSPVGPLPARLDYSDYRDVGGVKLPHRWTLTWLDGRSTYELTGIQPNATIDAARFARPAPPKPY
jgi:hypothetical protein